VAALTQDATEITVTRTVTVAVGAAVEICFTREALPLPNQTRKSQNKESKQTSDGDIYALSRSPTTVEW